MPSYDKLNIGQGVDQKKLGEHLGNLIGRATSGESSTAGDNLINQFNPDDPETKESKGLVDGTKGETVKSAPSQFNPFNVFRYKRFGLSQDNYELAKHLDSNLYGADVNGLNEEEDKSKANIFAYVKNALTEPAATPYDIGDFQRTVRNPTAKQIIEASRDANTGIIGPAPYAYNDFIYCKNYGKIPNNRLVTLRRYPQPVEDNLRISDAVKQQDPSYIQVPIAQALTYFGSGTDNDLNKVLPISWDVAWEKLTADVSNIKGNEVLADDLLTVGGITDETTQNLVRAGIALATGSSADKSALELAGYDAKLQEYIRDAYNPTDGPYWNRVLGPVNVINQSRKRIRGMGSTMFESPIRLKFSFALRSFNFVNTKVAMLDLISNFLTLTYNTAPFWGGGYRYFPKPGVKVSLKGQDLINEGKVIEGIQATLEEWQTNATGAVANALNMLAAAMGKVSGVSSGDETDGTKVELEKDASGKGKKTPRDIANLLLAGRSADLMQTPLSYRSLLEGRPIGEWHMTVGNPLDPMAVMGNLICTSCTMTFSDELGADDFPKEIYFDVELKHGKPRAKQDIESIFNLGGGPLSFSRLNPPSSTQGTFNGPVKTVDDIGTGAKGTENDPSSTNSNVTYIDDPDAVLDENNAADVGINIYKARVTNHYGSQYGSSTMLNDYIKKTRT